MSCPQCKKLSVVTEGRAEQLQTSVIVQEMLSMFKALESFSSEAGPQCQQCRDEVHAKAVAFCESCNKFICSDCCTAHRRWSTYSNHIVTMLKENMADTETKTEQHSASQSMSSTIPIAQTLRKSLQSKPVYCSKHTKEKLKFYCCTCKELVCSDCTVVTHRDHTVISVEEVLPDHKARMIQSLNALSSFSQLADESAGTILSGKEAITDEVSQAKKRITDVFATLEELVRTRKSELLAKVDEVSFEPLQKLQACSEQVESLRGQIITSQDFLKENLDHNGSTAMLSIERTVMHHIQQLCNSLQQLELPQEKSEVTVEFHDHGIETLFTEFGDVALRIKQDLPPVPLIESDSESSSLPTSSSPLPSESQNDTSFLINSFTSRLVDSLTVRRGSNMSRGQGHGHRNPRRMSSFIEIEREEISTCSTDSSSLPCSDDLSSIELSISSDVSKSNCKIVGVGIRTIEGLQLPGGISVNDRNQQLIVCEFGPHEVNIFDQCGSSQRKIGSKGTTNGHFLYPQKAAITHKGEMVVTDSVNRLQLFTAQGKWLRSVGLTGSGQLQFRDPVGVAVGTNRRFYICERENHRIQVLSQDLSFHKVIGKRGNGDCEFNSPSDIVADGRGFLYVADCWNHRIQVLNEDGVFIREFGYKGSSPGELNWPSHISVDADEALVMVTEVRNHRVSVFQTNGQFVKCFGRKGPGLGQLYKPRGIAMDFNKMIYVCDCGNNRIQVFK